MTLLTLGNPKTVKGESSGYLTAILHLAPASLSGRNVCPWSTKKCRFDCLNTAGRGGIIAKGKRTNAIQQCRIRRTRFFFEQRTEFIAQLAREIDSHCARAYRLKMVPAVRLNGTSDLPWERLAPYTIFERFPYVTFYDYTKGPKRILDYLDGRNWPANYSLTFSRSESNQAFAIQVLRLQGTVAVVFDTKRGAALPATWEGWPVIDGDLSDLRFRDPRAHVIGLRAKGRARRDTAGGFVVPAGNLLAS